MDVSPAFFFRNSNICIRYIFTRIVLLCLGETQTEIGRSDRPAGPEQSPVTDKLPQRCRKFVDEKVTEQREYQQRQYADKFEL